jgi:hypothetical protein
MSNRSPPIALSEAQMMALLAASYPLPPAARPVFLEACAKEIAAMPELGDGAFHHTIVRVQKMYFDPPDGRMPRVARGSGGHSLRKSLCFPMCPGDAYWGHFAAKKPAISTNGLIRSESWPLAVTLDPGSRGPVRVGKAHTESRCFPVSPTSGLPIGAFKYTPPVRVARLTRDPKGSGAGVENPFRGPVLATTWGAFI